MKKILDTVAQTVTFTFDGLGPVTLAMKDVSPANAAYAALHGFAARIGDNAAIAKSAENNFTVTEAMRRAEVEAMVKFYADAENVDWNMKTRAAPKATYNPAIAAIAAKLGKTYEEAMVWYNAKLMAELEIM